MIKKRIKLLKEYYQKNTNKDSVWLLLLKKDILSLWKKFHYILKDNNFSNINIPVFIEKNLLKDLSFIGIWILYEYFLLY